MTYLEHRDFYHSGDCFDERGTLKANLNSP